MEAADAGTRIVTAGATMAIGILADLGARPCMMHAAGLEKITC
jgi:hypothetical protein